MTIVKSKEVEDNFWSDNKSFNFEIMNQIEKIEVQNYNDIIYFFNIGKASKNVDINNI